ncbi:MAG: tyrosine-type recombinase/integrase [Proteobacteria bacterium]|nr:tyrosine-type recombinase/integrase [Pseudomonadota bacterium]
MGSVLNRGTRQRPNWYVKYKNEHGTWKQIPSKRPTKAQAREFLAQIEARVHDIRAGLVTGSSAPVDKPARVTCEPLMNRWLDGLRNRNAKDDRSRVRRHVLPRFAEMTPAEITLPVVMEWLDEQLAAGKLSDASIRHNLNALSRFFSWAIERGLAQINPVRQIPTGKRPQGSEKKNVPWLRDDAIVQQLIEELPKPIHYMFYLGNRSALRTGEIAGLRMSDFEFLDEGVIRVRYSYDGPLKEDKRNKGKVKWAPAADDCAEFLAPWLTHRKAAAAKPEDFVFPGPRFPERPCRKEYIEGHWERVRDRLQLKLTWYQATRHSFVSRLLEAGASLDEVSAALGHSSPVVTRRHYDHFIRRQFSPALKRGLGLGQATSEDKATGDDD